MENDWVEVRKRRSRSSKNRSTASTDDSKQTELGPVASATNTNTNNTNQGTQQTMPATTAPLHLPKDKMSKAQNQSMKQPKTPKSGRKGRLSFGSLKGNIAPVIQQQQRVTLHEQLQHTWKANLGQICFTDIPRLIRRVQIQTSGGVVHARTSKAAEPNTFRVLQHALVEAIRHFEGSERANAVFTATQDIIDRADIDNIDEPELLARDMFAPTIIAPTSPVRRVFEHIHQGIVLCAMDHLKATVLKDHVTKDVRSEDGWVVDIYLGEKMASVTHTRRERSVDFQNPDNFWDVVWEVCQTFDGSISDLTAAFLRILKLDDSHFSGEQSTRDSLRRELSSGLIVE